MSMGETQAWGRRKHAGYVRNVSLVDYFMWKLVILEFNSSGISFPFLALNKSDMFSWNLSQNVNARFYAAIL